MKTILFVAAGGALGSVMRYLISKIFTTSFPLGTLVVNVIGCFLIGFFYGIFANRGCNLSAETRAMLTVGLCGGFTTFSTFSNETFQLLSSGHVATALAYVASSIVIGVTMTMIAIKLS